MEKQPIKKLYSALYDSYCIWDGDMYINDGKVSSANFWTIEKAISNGFLPVLECLMFENIGQVRIEQAQEEIDRLNKQFPNTEWRIDNSPFMEVLDETDYNTLNPCPLHKGYVWVTCA